MNGLRVSPGGVDLDVFRAFIGAAGAVHDEPKSASGELMRFRLGDALGVVSQRKNGVLTFAGVARPLLDRMKEATRRQRVEWK